MRTASPGLPQRRARADERGENGSCAGEDQRLRPRIGEARERGPRCSAGGDDVDRVGAPRYRGSALDAGARRSDHVDSWPAGRKPSASFTDTMGVFVSEL